MSSVMVEQIRQAGIVGAGGAGFPTHVKLSGRADTVIINAAECEPLLHKDKEVLRAYPERVVEGLAAAMRLVGAERGLIGIKEKHQGVMSVLSPLLGAGMEIAPLPDAYPAGDEFVLVYETTGRVIPPGGLPLHVGAVVMNVETSYNVSGSAEAVTEKFVSVAGAVAKPCTVRAAVGATLRACLEAAGGATAAEPVYLVGGIMMGRLESDLDVPVTKTTGALIVLPAEHIVARRYRREWRHVARIGRSACDQCSFCTELCPRYLLGHPIEPHKAMRSLGFNLVGESNVLGTSFCCECGLCSLYSCPEDLDPRRVCGQNKRRLNEEDRRWHQPPFNSQRPGIHMANRKAPMQRLMQKLGLRQFVDEGPLLAHKIEPRRVGIELKQHVGLACEPCVRPGQAVSRGEMVGDVPLKDGKSGLGAPVHASIAGVVAGIEDGRIWIESR